MIPPNFYFNMRINIFKRLICKLTGHKVFILNDEFFVCSYCHLVLGVLPTKEQLFKLFEKNPFKND